VSQPTPSQAASVEEVVSLPKNLQEELDQIIQELETRYQRGVFYHRDLARRLTALKQEVGLR